MARPTRTRAQLRRDLAIRMMMPFAVRVPDGYGTVSAAGTPVQLIDTVQLLQPNDFWNGQWMYSPTADAVRKISDFAQTGSIATLEYALSSALTTSDTYEIHSIFNAIEMNNAINQAIEDGFPAFFDSTEDTSLVVQENKLEYDLTGFTSSVYLLHSVYIERPAVRIQATVASSSDDGTDTTIILDACDITNISTDWRLSCYDGASEGFSLAVKSFTAGTYSVTLDGMPTTAPADGDKVMLWDTREQYLDWYRLRFYRSTPREWPNKLHLPTPVESWLGSRLKVIYSTMPSRLTTDTSTTVVPQEYIMLSAMASLYGSRVGDNRVDRQRYAMLQEQYAREAEIYKQIHSFRYPQTEIKLEGEDQSFEFLNIDGNPMGW